MPITTCIFDAYGTLFDVAAAARQAASEPDSLILGIYQLDVTPIATLISIEHIL